MATIEQSVSQGTPAGQAEQAAQTPQLRQTVWAKAAAVAFREKLERDRKDRERQAETRLAFETNNLVLLAQSLSIPESDFEVQLLPDLDQSDSNEFGVYDEDSEQYRRVVLNVAGSFLLVRAGTGRYYAAKQTAGGEFWYGPIYEATDLGAFLADAVEPHQDSPALVEARVDAMERVDAKAKGEKLHHHSLEARQVIALEAIATHLGALPCIAEHLGTLAGAVEGSLFQVRNYGTDH